jgi:hypothetical protein
MVSLRFVPGLLLIVACGVPPPDDGPAPPEVTLKDVHLRSYRGSTLTAVGQSSVMTYERSSADVLARQGILQVFRNEIEHVPGVPPPSTRIVAASARGNLLSRGIDTTGGVSLRTPTGLEGWTEAAHLDSNTMHARGSNRVTVRGPNGYWLQAGGFELQLREDVYEFFDMKSRVSAL